jgi:glycosyltransferase involved in cell wall biosynthesis
MSTQGEFKVAIVHDELTRRGGAEIVLEEIIRLFPGAEVYSLYTGRPLITIDGQDIPVHTSSLQQWPAWFRRHPGRLLPMLPQAAEQLDLSHVDLIISSSSGFAKNIVPRSHIPHLCYCHTPTRYLWDSNQDVIEQAPLLTRWPLRLTQHYLRLVDYSSAQRVDRFIANSRYTQERIASYYRRDSAVIYPPIDTTFFTPGASIKNNTDRPFLVVGRLTPSKRFDQAIIACEKLGVPLLVIGRGSEARHLKVLAGRQTKFIERVSKTELRHHYRQARAVLQPGVEDFGMVAAEAHACGTPVIAYGVGGVREIVVAHQTGLLYKSQRVEALAEAMRQFLTSETGFPREKIQQQSLRFAQPAFKAHFLRAVQELVTAKLAAIPAKAGILVP